ncbi:MAG TPA: transglycosylase SLT domain-containing protein [Paucimonas sp.]|nr:transglycosylase SLT domain-containing protein [Paucimonas sp.]
MRRSNAATWFRPGCLAWLLAAVACSATWAGDLPPDAQRHRRDLVRNARLIWGLDAPVATFAAQIHQESRWRADAVSPVGAIGMAQFMPATARWIAGAYPALAGNQPTNPVWALRALVTYDRHLWERIKAASPCDRMAMTLAAYNGGLGWVWRDQKMAAAQGADRARWFDQVERFNAGRSKAAFTENRGYPRLILRTFAPRYAAAGWGRGSCA